MLDEHLGYISDLVRRGRYEAAVSRLIRGGEHVVDLGAGSGILGLMCLQAGAAKVYAIDATAMLEVARQSLLDAGYGDKAVFIEAFSTRASLPSRVDVVICDQVGYFGFDAGIVEYLADAHRRFLKPGAITIPRRIELLLAPIESTKLDAKVKAWKSKDTPAAYHWVSELSVNTLHAVNFLPPELLGPPAELGAIDLGVEQREFFQWSAEMTVDRSGELHGLGGWFDCELAPGVRMTNSPVAAEPIQRAQVFLPLSEPAHVQAGDVIHATVMARPAVNMISWEVGVAGGAPAQRHSTWLGGLISKSELASRNPTHVPRLSEYGRARSTVLELCDGVRSVAQIGEALALRHPDLFDRKEELSRFVASTLAKDAAR